MPSAGALLSIVPVRAPRTRLVRLEGTASALSQEGRMSSGE